MKRINLNKGKVTIVDDKDYEKVKIFTWFINGGYACTSIWKNGKAKKIYLHRLIMNSKEGILVDHINRDKLDNRKSNLRFCDRKGNIGNCKLFKTNTTGFRGIIFQKDIKKYRVRISLVKGHIEGGTFNRLDEAVKKRDILYKEYFGEFFTRKELLS